jgi:Putative restriction endonuclease
MNVHLPTQMSKAAFIVWMNGREGRYELVAGRVVLMSGVSRRHQVISEFGLDAEPQTLRYPDIIVDAVGGGGKDSTAIAPVLLVESLSPSTVEIDLRDKTAEYLQLPSVKAYLVFSQDEPKAWIWLRVESGSGAGPQIVAGDDRTISIREPAVELSMSFVYAGLPAN